MTYSNDPQPNPYAHIPSPIPNIDFPQPYWINKLRDLLLIGCTDPDLAMIALAVPAAMKAAWTVLTPSTKQIIEHAGGRSWICGSKQIISQVEYGSEIANNGAGRFVYGLLAGLDIAAYHAFFLSTGAAGVIDWASYAKRFTRNCGTGQSPYRGLDAIGGWPGGTEHSWLTGPEFLNSGGVPVGPLLTVPAGQVGIMLAWCSFSGLGISGGVQTSMRIIDHLTGEVLDEDYVDNLNDTNAKAVVQYCSNEGIESVDRELWLEVFFHFSLASQNVTGTGGCYMRAFDQGAGNAPPYWNMKSMLKSNKGA